jgi:UDP-N-acetylenolpyruvoylglucosamine reductase
LLLLSNISSLDIGLKAQRIISLSKRLKPRELSSVNNPPLLYGKQSGLLVVKELVYLLFVKLKSFFSHSSLRHRWIIVVACFVTVVGSSLMVSETVFLSFYNIA